MNSVIDAFKQSLLRALIIAGIVTGFSYAVHGAAAFNSMYTAFEFFANGVAIGIAYAAFKVGQYRNGCAALLGWYVIFTGFIARSEHSWNYFMVASYIIFLAGAVYLCLRINNKWFANARIQRIIATTLIIALTHGIVVIFLQLVTGALFSHPLKALEWSYMNFRNGTLIGILSALGMELAEYAVASYQKYVALHEQDGEEGQH
jgi:hypothetical protein